MNKCIGTCVHRLVLLKDIETLKYKLFHRIVYFLACCFNTVSMMTSCVVFVMLVFLPCSSYVGRYHIMAIIILGAALLLVQPVLKYFCLWIFWSLLNSVNQVATLVSITLAIFGLDASNLKVLILEIIISFHCFYLLILIHDDFKFIIPTWIYIDSW